MSSLSKLSHVSNYYGCSFDVCTWNESQMSAGMWNALCPEYHFCLWNIFLSLKNLTHQVSSTFPLSSSHNSDPSNKRFLRTYYLQLLPLSFQHHQTPHLQNEYQSGQYELPSASNAASWSELPHIQLCIWYLKYIWRQKNYFSIQRPSLIQI